MRLIIASLILSVLFAVSAVTASDVHAQVFKLQLSNPSQSIKSGDSFDVKVLINTASEQTINGDALITFEPAKISAETAKIVSGNFFTYFSANMLGGSDNKVLISSWEESIARPKTSSTDTLFSTMTLKALNSGSTTLSFECTAGNEADSNINRASDSKDIIKCPLTPLTINIGGTGITPTTIPTATPIATASPTLKPAPTNTPAPTPTIRPTSTPVPTNTPRPTVSVLPRAGTMEMTLGALGVGIVLTVMGILFIL